MGTKPRLFSVLNLAV